MSSTTLIANLIEEEALLGSVSVVSSLTHGNGLSRGDGAAHAHFSNEDGVLINEVLLPTTPSSRPWLAEGTWKWPTTRRCCIREIKAIVVADEDVLDDVRLAFRGSSGCGKGRLHVAWAESGGTLIRGCEIRWGRSYRVFQFAQTVLVRLPRRNQGTLIRSDSPRLVKQPTGLFQSLMELARSRHPLLPIGSHVADRSSRCPLRTCNSSGGGLSVLGGGFAGVGGD